MANPPDVWQQLGDLALKHPPPGTGQGREDSGQSRDHAYSSRHHHHHPPPPPQSDPGFHYQQHPPPPPPPHHYHHHHHHHPPPLHHHLDPHLPHSHYRPHSDMDPYPRVGYSPSIASTSSDLSSQPFQAARASQPAPHQYPHQPGARDYPYQARGGGFPVHHHPRHPSSSNNSSAGRPQMPSDGHTRRGRRGGPPYHFAPGSVTNSRSPFSNPAPDLRQQVMAQSDYLNNLQMQARASHQLKPEESRAKENFRKRLEALFQKALTQKYPGIKPSEIRLKCYGSLNNGFGLANCDMDLLLALPAGFTLEGGPRSVNKELEDAANSETPFPPAHLDSLDAGTTDGHKKPQSQATFELGRLLEDVLLDAEIGARLLTNTRVPIIKVCEKPDDELLQSLRESAKESRVSLASGPVKQDRSPAPYPPLLDMAAIQDALNNLEDSAAAAEVSIPGSPKRPAATNLEFSEEHGIKCDVNFSNFVALHNTRLLKEYCNYDPRVAEVGVFVKTWAKLRDINTPYLGTLSSYGYVLMVLHYLMNVVKPPVIPNLQALAVDDDAWNPSSPVHLFEGKYDVRFWSDKDKISSFKSSARRNRESAGHLIRGFFWYYSAREGFNYRYDVISIRTPGGIVRKQTKGWTEAKWADDKRIVRQRYLLAIEDPFETEHNVARVVGHHGLCAIRDEFRRAWDIISKIGPGLPPDSELLEPVENRGDTLRKDQNFHRQKIRDKRAEAEAKAPHGHKTDVQDGFDVQANGMFYNDESSVTSESSPSVSRCHSSSNHLLTRTAGNFQDRPNLTRRSRFLIKDDTDDESDAKNEDEVMSGKPRADTATTTITTITPTDSTPLSDQSKIETTYLEEPSQTFSLTEDEADSLPPPFCDPKDILASNGKDAQGRLLAWDLSTHDGRWLHWRDQKIRSGRWQGHAVARPDLILINEMCPYDPRRPRSKRPFFGDRARDRAFMNYALKPPVPMIKDQSVVMGQNNSDTAPERSDHAPEPNPLPAEIQTQPVDVCSGEQVGFPIPWDTSTRGGRWLKGRDVHVRDGSFKVPRNPTVARLHELFPCDPNMTQTQLDDYNQALRMHHKHSLKPVSVAPKVDARSVESLRFDPSPLSLEDDNLHNSDAPTNAKELNDSLPPSRPSSAHQQQARAGHVPDSAFIRSSRLAFFARKEVDEKMKQMDDDDEQDDHNDLNNQTEQDGGRIFNVQELMKEAGIIHAKPKVSGQSGPRPLPFAFDARQLQDLAVIKEGGNACQRKQDERDIKHGPGLGDTGEQDYEYGRGDEEGFLGELPGYEI